MLEVRCPGEKSCFGLWGIYPSRKKNVGRQSAKQFPLQAREPISVRFLYCSLRTEWTMELSKKNVRKPLEREPLKQPTETRRVRISRTNVGNNTFRQKKICTPQRIHKERSYKSRGLHNLRRPRKERMIARPRSPKSQLKTKSRSRTP